ncbi:unnamed protein product [Phytomonas sp. Hart1]|nr:unnamed protein product [Phytomonas sp. Hart1]|eukprot:CCW71421.1 unnamed protein product [Phytomonas sp. isolate Hart1]
MIFISNFFSDDNYKESLNTNPLPSICIVGEKALFLKQSFQQAETSDFQIHLTFYDSLDVIKPKKQKLHDTTNNGLLKSKWCFKHQYQDFGCILLSIEISEDRHGATFEQLNNLLKGINDRLIRSYIVLVGITQETTNDPDKEFFNSLHQLATNQLGERLYAFTTISDNPANHSVVSTLRKILVAAALNHHKNEIIRLKEKKKLLSLQRHSVLAIARTYFQIAWHYLISFEYEEVKKNLHKAYKILRSFFSNFPPLDVRMVTSLFLHYIVSVLPLCGDVLSVESELFETISSHINWVGHAFTSQYDSSCRKLASALKSALVAEWCGILARKTLDIKPLMRSDFLISAANNLHQIKSFSQLFSEKTTRLSSPLYIGTECISSVYADAFFGMFRQSVSSVHISGLLKEASATSSPQYRKYEKLYFEMCAHETVNLSFLETLLERNLNSLYLSDFLCALVLDKCDDHCMDTKNNKLLYYILINGSVSPLSLSSQIEFWNRLEKFSEQPVLTLHYPHGSFQPPFTVLTQIEHNSVEASDGRAPLILIFFTTSVQPIILTNIQITLQNINSLDAESGILEASVVGSYKVEASGSIKAKAEITFPRNGKFICNKLWATVSMGVFKFDIIWTLHEFSGDTRSKRSFILANTPILNVTKPISFANVSSAISVEAVESEDFRIPITIEGKENLLTNVSITFLYLPDFFSGALYFISGENDDIMPCERILGSKDESTYALNDLFPGHTMSLLLCGKCSRSGVYQIPILFRHSTKDFMDMKIVRVSVLVINPPFSVDYSCFTSTLWSSDAGEVNFPTMNSVYQQRDLNILEKPKDTKLLQTSTSTAEWYSKNAALYYTVRSEDASSKTQLKTSVGEMVSFLINLTCTAGKKITVLKSDIICSEELHLHSLSYGELPCVLDEEESVSIFAQLRAWKKGVLSPGFVRILFAPQSSPSSHFVADFSLPPIIIEDSEIRIKYVYPSTILFGYTIILKLVIFNSGKDLFRGELLVDTRSDCFSMRGRTRWNLAVCPQDNTEERIELIPLKVGELPLPFIQLNDIHGSPVVTQPIITHHVTVLSGQQPYLAFNTLIHAS